MSPRDGAFLARWSMRSDFVCSLEFAPGTDANEGVDSRVGARSPGSDDPMPSSAVTAARPKPPRSALPSLWRGYWKRPGDQTRNRLVEAYQGLVHEVVQRFAQRLPRSVERGDLLTAANVGLMAAVASFDPTRRVRFEAYAEMRIRGALLDELRSQDWLPRPWRTRLDLQKRAVQALRGELAREPGDEEVARALGIPLLEYELRFGTALPGTPGGSMPGNDGEDALFLMEGLADVRSGPPGEEITRTELLRLLAQRMSEQEYRIVYLRYWEELSMREIGELTGLSESRVCKIHTRLLERLKDRFRAQESGNTP
jgi:RNA polymerase sigma factor for flagellar operon FliA